MEDRRFDSFVKSLASGTNRRSMLKGLLGLGGAAVAGGTLLEPKADAATRSTPAPKPVKCPGNQYWDGAKCTCTTGEICGPACCPNGSECCDGACCDGHCYGEELCCSHDNWCDEAGECCPDGATCCGAQGCVVIEEGDCGCGGECPEGFECCGGQCCASGFCAGELCCALGVCGGVCYTGEGQQCCEGQPYDPETQYCCDGTVVAGECCASSGCPEGFECCNGGCCASGYCAGETSCCAFAVCGDVCVASETQGCCNGFLYEIGFAMCCGGHVALAAGNICCDDVFYEGGNCCANADCGSCGNCVNHVCGQPRC